MKHIDARGLACPAPVLQAKAAIEDENLFALSVLVDNEAAKQNVSRFLESQNFKLTIEQNGDGFTVSAQRKEGAESFTIMEEEPEIKTKKIMLMVATDRMGRGDDDLGKKLMKNFIKTLKEMGPDLWRLVFVNSGVKLTIEGAETLEDIKALDSNERQILVCGTCLDHFDLLDRKKVGETTNMLDIVTAMQLADQVINI